VRAGISILQERGASFAKLALQFAVATSPCITTIVGSASASHVRRDVEWISESIDADLLVEVEAIIAHMREMGWVNGRSENQHPGRLP
jgi:L-galactose dehydrogenase